MAGELHALKIEAESLQAEPTQQHTHSPGHERHQASPPQHAPEHPMAWGQQEKEGWLHHGGESWGPVLQKVHQGHPQQGDRVSLGALCHPGHAEGASPTAPAGIVQLSETLSLLPLVQIEIKKISLQLILVII